MSISSIVRQLRVLNAAAKETRSKAQWDALRLQKEYIAYEDMNEVASETKEIQCDLETL